jgi:RNA polymerase sigma-70 factor (ECF subfamily)
MNNSRELQDGLGDDYFNALFAKYNKLVYYTAFSITKEHDLSQDVVQETFIKVYRYLDALKGYQKKEAWLKMIAKNIAIDFIEEGAEKFLPAVS